MYALTTGSRAEKTLLFLAEYIMLYVPEDFVFIVEPGNYYQITRLGCQCPHGTIPDVVVAISVFDFFSRLGTISQFHGASTRFYKHP